MKDTPGRAVGIYLLFTLLFSAACWALIIASGRLGMGFGQVVMVLMWCPALGAFAACRRLGRSVRSLGWAWPAGRHAAAAYAIPLAYAALVYGAVWALGLGGWNRDFAQKVAAGTGLRGIPEWASLVLFVALSASGGVIRSMASALGEEIGWRGFLVPELAKRMSFTKLSLVSGLVWAAWHSPILLFADYNAGTHRGYALACFAVTVVAMSFVMAWFRLKSGSLWTAAILHASHNLFLQAIFDNLMRDTGRTLWITTEFGAGLALACTAVALLVWRRRGEVDGPAPA